MELKRWRDDHGMTQAQLAAALSLSVWTVAQWEQGRRKVPNWLDVALRGLER